MPTITIKRGTHAILRAYGYCYNGRRITTDADIVNEDGTVTVFVPEQLGDLVAKFGADDEDGINELMLRDTIIPATRVRVMAPAIH